MPKKVYLYSLIAIILVTIVVTGTVILQKKNSFSTPYGSNSTVSQKKVVSTSLYPLEFLVKNIASDQVEVFNPIPNGAEAHEFEPTIQDIQKINTSILFVYQGSGFDSWAQKASLNTIDSIVATDYVQKLPAPTNDHQENEKDHQQNQQHHSDQNQTDKIDPHTWMRPKNMILVATQILNKLTEIQPENTDLYTKNYKELVLKLQKLDADFTSGLANCNKNQIVVSHNAFRYLAIDYGFTIDQLAGLEPNHEPTPQDIVKIVNIIKDNNLKSVFYETNISPKVAEAVARETNTKTQVLYSLESLDEDLKNSEQNYITLMNQNLRALEIALECQK